MKKKFKIKDVDCADCAAKMQEAINGIDGVMNAKLNFLTEKLTIEADESRFDEILDIAEKEMRKIDKEASIIR